MRLGGHILFVCISKLSSLLCNFPVVLWLRSVFVTMAEVICCFFQFRRLLCSGYCYLLRTTLSLLLIMFFFPFIFCFRTAKMQREKRKRGHEATPRETRIIQREKRKRDQDASRGSFVSSAISRQTRMIQNERANGEMWVNDFLFAGSLFSCIYWCTINLL